MHKTDRLPLTLNLRKDVESSEPLMTSDSRGGLFFFYLSSITGPSELRAPYSEVKNGFPARWMLAIQLQLHLLSFHLT